MGTGAANNTLCPGASLGKHMVPYVALVRHDCVNEASAKGSGKLFHLPDCDSTFTLFALRLIDCSF